MCYFALGVRNADALWSLPLSISVEASRLSPANAAPSQGPDERYEMATLPVQIDAAKLGAGLAPESVQELERLIAVAQSLTEAEAAVESCRRRREEEVVRAVDVYRLDHHRIATALGLTDGRIGQILIEAG